MNNYQLNTNNKNNYKRQNQTKTLKLIFNVFILTFVLISNYSNSYSIENLKYTPDIFFGKSTKDDKLVVREFEMINLNKTPIRFDRLSIIDLDGNKSQVFTFDPTIKFPIILVPNRNERFRIGAEPQKAIFGRNIAKLILYSTNIRDSIEINLILNLTKDSIIIAAPKLSYSIGDTFDLPIFIKGTNIPIEVNSLELTLKFNHTIMTPINKIERGMVNKSEMIIVKRIEITPNLRLKQTDTLFNIQMLALLGNSTYSDIEIINIDWYFNNIPNNRIATIRENGIFETNNIFYDDGVPRLVTFNNFILNTYALNDNLVRINYKIKSFDLKPQISVFDINLNQFPLILIEENEILENDDFINISLVYKLDDKNQALYLNNNLFFLNFIQNDLIMTKKILNFKN